MEFALLFPIFIIVVLGTMSVGTAFSKQINITQAARETSRFGATLTFAAATATPPPTVDAWLRRVSTAGQAAAGSASDPLGGHDFLCVAFIVPADLDQTAHMINNGSPVYKEPCPNTVVNNALGPKYVQVVVRRETNLFAVFLDADIRLDAESTTPYEPGNVPQPTPTPTPSPTATAPTP